MYIDNTFFLCIPAAVWHSTMVEQHANGYTQQLNANQASHELIVLLASPIVICILKLHSDSSCTQNSKRSLKYPKMKLLALYLTIWLALLCSYPYNHVFSLQIYVNCIKLLDVKYSTQFSNGILTAFDVMCPIIAIAKACDC